MPTSRPVGQLGADRELWASIWTGEPGPNDEQDERWLQGWMMLDHPALAPITAEQVRAASQAFAHRASATCGWHPRHYARLSEATLEGVAVALNEAEKQGRPPGRISTTVTRLIGAKRRP